MPPLAAAVENDIVLAAVVVCGRWEVGAWDRAAQGENELTETFIMMGGVLVFGRYVCGDHRNQY